MQRDAPLGIGGEQLLDERRGGRIDLHGCRVTGPLGVQPIAVRRTGPRQELPSSQFGQPPTPHPIRDQRTLVLGDRATDLQDELVVRIVAGRPIDEHHADARRSNSSRTTIWCT